MQLSLVFDWIESWGPLSKLFSQARLWTVLNILLNILTAVALSTGAAFFLVYNPNGKPVPRGVDPNGTLQNLQIGYMDSNGAVQTGGSVAANNVNLLAQTVVLNYMALHGEEGDFFTSPYFGTGTGDAKISDIGEEVATIDKLAIFEPIVNGTLPS